jgi:predicted nicotinamide N-methyase
LRAVPFVPEIQLYQADEATGLWHRTERELDIAGLPPPFWAFAWAGGRGLARYVLDNRGAFRGRRVLDFASGSGLVAIAAAMSGATDVEAIDIDPFAVAAITLNAAANRVAICPVEADRIDQNGTAEIVLAADIFYDRQLASKALPWLRRMAAKSLVLVGDPGRSYCPRDGITKLASYSVPVESALEEGTLKTVSILQILPEDAGQPDKTCDRASMR